MREIKRKNNLLKIILLTVVLIASIATTAIISSIAADFEVSETADLENNVSGVVASYSTGFTISEESFKGFFIELAVEFKFNENIYPDLASLKFNSYIYDDNYVVIEDGDNPGTPFQFTSRYFYEENKNLINMSYNEYMDYGWDILTPRDNNFGSENIIDVENNLVTCKFLIEDTVGALKNFPVLNLSIRDIEYKKFSDDIINKEDIQNITSSLTSIGNKEYIFNITR